MYKIKSSEAFNLLAVRHSQSFNKGLVAECSIPSKPYYCNLNTIVSFAYK